MNTRFACIRIYCKDKDSHTWRKIKYATMKICAEMFLRVKLSLFRHTVVKKVNLCYRSRRVNMTVENYVFQIEYCSKLHVKL
jgi:hypothetical protein